MNSFFRWAGFLPLCFFSLAHAGQDPLRWSMSSNVPANSQLNHSYSVNFTVTSTLPFTMPTSLYISNNSSPAAEVTMVDDCSGTKLTPNQSCNVGLVLIPKTAGTKTLSVFMEYGSNKVQIPVTPVTSTTSSAVNNSIQGIVTVGFPSAILSNATYPLTFTFENNTSSALSSVSVSADAGNTAGYTQSSSTCGATLAAGASCVVTGSFITSATSGAVTVGLTLSSSGGSASATTSSIINNNTNLTTRTFNFVNNCSQTVWFGFSSSSVNNNPCTSDADCANGSFCDPAANSGAGLCFYANPTPTNGSYQLSASGGTNSVTVTDYGLQYVWSGNLAARTGPTCGTGTCDTGDCGSSTGNQACPVGQGFAQPATLAEFTLLRDSVDSYDVSIINGMNVGVQIQPTTTGTFTSQGNLSYNCQSPGKVAPVPSLGLGGCNWTSGFVPPAYPDSTSASSYVYVKPPTSGATPCTASSPTCNSLSPYTTCGLSFNRTNNTLSKVCGEFLGYVTANQVCSFANTNLTPGSSNNPGDPYFGCDNALSGSLSNFTYWGLLACQAQKNGDLGTCYNSVNTPISTPNCCGCVNWQGVSGVTVPSDTTVCVQTNTQWTSISTGVQPGLEWLKKACPTAYVYPFDDKSSGFSCMDINSSHPVNTVNYTITFCPA